MTGAGHSPDKDSKISKLCPICKTRSNVSNALEHLDCPNCQYPLIRSNKAQLTLEQAEWKRDKQLPKGSQRSDNTDKSNISLETKEAQIKPDSDKTERVIDTKVKEQIQIQFYQIRENFSALLRRSLNDTNQKIDNLAQQLKHIDAEQAQIDSETNEERTSRLLRKIDKLVNKQLQESQKKLAEQLKQERLEFHGRLQQIENELKLLRSGIETTHPKSTSDSEDLANQVMSSVTTQLNSFFEEQKQNVVLEAKEPQQAFNSSASNAKDIKTNVREETSVVKPTASLEQVEADAIPDWGERL
jgi:hypothetical protein